MKKATLPHYTILVIGCVACLQADDNLNISSLTAYVSGKENGSNSKNSNTIIVAPGMFNDYKPIKSKYSLTKALQNDCCGLAAGDMP